MTIECYNSGCKYHSCHYDKDDGPFCHEIECHQELLPEAVLEPSGRWSLPHMVTPSFVEVPYERDE